ncbi:MAG: F0F1 ATP synthase subunit B [Parvularculaceae bacterium]
MIDLLLASAAAATEAAHGAGHAPTPLLQDTATWVSLGFLVVVSLFGWFGVHNKIAAALDKRAQGIADELDRARALRDEAQELLAKYQRRQREAEEEAEAIIEQAKRDAARIAAEAREKIEEQLERRAKAAEDKIARAEAQAIAEVRGQTADLAIEAARDIIRNRMDQGAQSALAERAIDEIRSKLH